MAELADRERVNQELRAHVHAQFEHTRDLISNYQGPESQKAKFVRSLSKMEGLASDRSRRLKSDTLRRLLDNTQTLISKITFSVESSEIVVAQVEALPTENVDSGVQHAVSSSGVSEEANAKDAVNPERSAAARISPPKEQATSPVKQTDNLPIVLQEVISEEAKLKQKPQIPWRTPDRLESNDAQEPYAKDIVSSSKTGTKSSSVKEPFQICEPERLALRYPMKTKKRAAEDEADVDIQFKKPLPMPSESHKPLFQRRHQLPPTQPVYSKRDPRNYGDYCRRRQMQLQNRVRFENQNQQYYRHSPTAVTRGPAEISNTFVVPAPVPPTPPTQIIPSNAIVTQRQPASRIVTAPIAAQPLGSPAATNSTATVRSEHRKTINPVYSSNEPIALGKKEQSKKIVPHSKVVEKAKADEPKKNERRRADELLKTDDTATKSSEKSRIIEGKVTEKVQNVKVKTKVQDKNKQNSINVKQNTLKENDLAGQNKLMDLLKEIGDEDKVNRILNLMKNKSDDEITEKEVPLTKKVSSVTKTKNLVKSGRKMKRVQTILDDSSSEDETVEKLSPKKDQKKDKSKVAKRTGAGSRELNQLIENSLEWMSKGAEINLTRRRNVTTQALVQAEGTITKSSGSKPTVDEVEHYTSDEENTASANNQLKDEDSLLTVAKVAPVLPKGKSKAKENSFIYNDKKQVHYNSNYSSNCALCSFNGSAIVDHYVYDHKQYEVFVSRVSPKMADIIRAEPFLTNGILVNESSNEKTIRFKCFFCLTIHEMTQTKWIEHLASHTGEYRYRCTSCPVMSQNQELPNTFFHEKTCLKPVLALYNVIEFQDNHIYGYMCEQCNYIQIRRVNMERHLKREHPSADVTCIRFSIVNYKIETKPVVDEDQMMTDLTPNAMIPLQPKGEPAEACEIVNQPFTEDDEAAESAAQDGSVSVLLQRSGIRLNSVHIGPAGVYGRLEHRPFIFKEEQELQGDQISSSDNFFESPGSPEMVSSEAQAVVPILQIESVQGGIHLGKSLFKLEPRDADYDSDASDKTTDFNMSDATEEGQQSGEKTNTGTGSAGGNTGGGASGNPDQSTDNSGSTGASGSNNGGAGAGGDGGDERKPSGFPVPVKVKVEKKDEEKEKKKEEEELTTSLEKVVIKTEKTDNFPEEPPIPEYDFVELVLDSTRIEHVAYLEKQGDILHLCLMPGCKYISKNPSDFTSHISKRHSQIVWDGYCYPCQSQIVIMDNCTIANELQHLLEVHARKKTPTPEIETRPPVSNVIRIRKMPGDTLSITDSNPPPLTPLTLPVSSTAQGGPSPITLGQPGHLIIQSSSTISPMALGNNAIITPTHTIPAQIRPIGNPNIGATMTSSNNSSSTMTASTNSAAVPSVVNLRINTVRLKPWTNMVTTKNQEHCRNMLEETSLLCLYKCMARSCAFTTNNRYFMEQHLNLHETRYVSGPSAPRKCWLECAYCELIAPNCTVLLVHIDQDHSTCGFQCNLCFYRSRDPTNVVVHQKTYHPTNLTTKNILIMPDNLQSFGDDEWRSMQESLRKNVLPLHCTICKESYYILSAYMSHLAGHTQSFVKCQVCNLNIDKKSMARHLLLHSIGLYECVYCLFGANTKSTMALHVSNAHCSKPLYCCVRYNKKRSDGVDFPPNKIESMELKTMSCNVSPDLFKRCIYTSEQLNFKPVDLNTNQTMGYTKPVQKVVSGTVATPVSNPNNPAPNIQIQITDEAGRPLIISIPVQNSAPKPSAPVPVPVPVPAPAQSSPLPVQIAPTVQMPMITTVQGGVPISPQPQQQHHNQSPLPVISSVQGMATLPPLAAIQRVNDSLPVISSVHSVAQGPTGSPLAINNAATSNVPMLTNIAASGLGILPHIPGITITAKPTTTTAVTSSSTVTSTQPTNPVSKDQPPMVSVADSISSTGSLVPKSTSEEQATDIYATTVAEADTQSSNNVNTQQNDNTVSLDSDDEMRTIGDGESSSKSSTPVHSHSPIPGGKSSTGTSQKKFSSTTQIRIDFLFKGTMERFDRLEQKVGQMIKHTGFCGPELNVCGVEKCASRFSDPVKLNLHLLKHHNVGNYKCYHCTEKFKSAHELITHIKTHGRHRYMCFICDRKSHFLKMMILHVQHDHNSKDVILTYLHPKKRDIHNDLVVICPQNVTGAQLQAYIDKILKDDVSGGVTATVAEKKKFGVEDIDRLPLQDIYLEDVSCAQCDYSTKIRKNLRRHLEKHLDNSKGTVSPDILSGGCVNVPQMVLPIKLYLCGICQFDCPPVLTDFRTHLYRTHRKETVYRCPHCEASLNEGPICIDKIINHLKLHGENLYKCSECDFYRDERYLVLAHIKKNHSSVVTAAVKIIREARSLAGASKSSWQCDLCESLCTTREEIVMHMTADHKLTDKQYKCSQCSYKSSDHDSFKPHFSEQHPNSEILIIALFHEVPSADTVAAIKTDIDQSSTMPFDENKKNKFACGSENCTYSSTNLEGVKRHFMNCHPDQTLAVYDESITDKEKRKRFDYFVKYVCNHCQLQCDTIDDVVEHWSCKHKNEVKKPLMFKLFKLVRCFYCDKLSSYYDIKMHATVSHPGQTFACVDHQNVFKCGECPFVLTGVKIDLLKHFKIYHSASKNEDPCDYIDDEFLHRMLEQNNSTYTCNHCKLTFDSRFEYENHIDVCSLAGLPASFSLSSKSVRIRYICSCCNEMFADEYSIAKHMRTHLAQYNCRYCKREFKQLIHLNHHQMTLHNAKDTEFLTKDLNQYRNFFLKIKMLFPNGLLLSKVDAYRTVCGSVEDIINYARSCNEDEHKELMYERAIELPLHYRNDSGIIVITPCKEFLTSRPKMLIMLDNLDDDQLKHLKEQAYLLAKASGEVSDDQMVLVPNSTRNARNIDRRKRTRTRRSYKRIASSNSETDDEDDDDWQPGTKRMNLRTKTSKSFADRDFIVSDHESESDDDFLINLKKERL
ncbi:uncharacterized protein LOC129724436 isoform X2 [Wyeomyia smithii]|nr:uncharacterized protein LOC129724436 isoform X2 [Wyeomyia smithii]